jgi:hypothetical protein
MSMMSLCFFPYMMKPALSQVVEARHFEFDSLMEQRKTIVVDVLLSQLQT